MAGELTSAEYAYLIILKAEDREISNTEMARLYEVRLKSPDYEKLNADGYVKSATKQRPYRHVITDKGVGALTDLLAVHQARAQEGERRSTGERQLYWAAIVAQQKLIARLLAQGNGVTAGRDERSDLDGRVRAAYEKLACAPGEWVKLTALRGLLADVSKAELDTTLARMLDTPDVRLEPEPFGHRIGVEERRAAVHIAGEDRHKLAIGRR